MDGRVLPVLLDPTGHPPKQYRIPVPDPDGGPPTVLIYRRVPRGQSKLGLQKGWKYAYEPEGRPSRLKWPWSRPDATPGGKPDDTDG